MTAAESALQKIIAEKGMISLAEYMEICLQHPTQGYYCAHSPLGAQGDFITAPEISQMFGEIIGIWMLDLWQKMGCPKRVNILELGPGRGALMADMLRAAAQKMSSVYHIHLVEINPSLRRQQADVLRSCPHLSWHTDISEALEACDEAPLFIIANEFFDALPIRQFKRHQNKWMEHMIKFEPDAQKYNSVWQHVSESALPHNRSSLSAQDSIVEVSPQTQASLDMLTTALLKQTGAMLIIDYGYTQGRGDTLQAVRNHQYHPMLETPGSADMSAHVDFTALVEVASEKGAKTFGPVNQGDFLIEMGILSRAATLSKGATAAQQKDIESALLRLTHPQHMGTLFKALAITSPHLPQPHGFTAC